MTAQIPQITQTQQKKQYIKGREMKKKLSKFNHLAISGDFGHVFIISQTLIFQFFLLIPFDPCGHFEYNKPRFDNNLKEHKFYI